MAARVPGDTSVDAHHAGNAGRDSTNAPGASGSVDAHHAADDITDTTLALMSYNIGIQNAEIRSSRKWTGKYTRPLEDVRSAFTKKVGIQVLASSCRRVLISLLIFITIP